ncbi:DUF1905 domain-containing protein [Novosphingobium sp. FSW06-99]|uniref:DUF1905 domain-containing protein n=1 Tax=Novosphingobium sp. FSW06-99 TaxID=1739113 RepID=UPI00076C52F3|nr:DUF1905 domain-containing protein [Novosphingobium sp. FSW06-99]KUR74038.1 hypothetical protein AQZ49_19020 [Novosphingobium sp. FSW06-99]
MTGEETHRFTTTLVQWRSEGHGVWHFIGVTADVAEALDGTALMHRLESGRRSGFGSVKLTIRIGETEWRTSAFPIKHAGWSIPVSAKVRKAEGLVVGDALEVCLTF